MVPKQLDFDDAYQNDGIKQRIIRFKEVDGDVIDLSDSLVKIDLVDDYNRVAWTFSSANGSITFTSEGSIVLPEIKSWAIKPGKYTYDLQVTDSTGFVTTFLRGKWNVVSDLTKTI